MRSRHCQPSNGSVRCRCSTVIFIKSYRRWRATCQSTPRCGWDSRSRRQERLLRRGRWLFRLKSCAPCLASGTSPSSRAKRCSPLSIRRWIRAPPTLDPVEITHFVASRRAAGLHCERTIMTRFVVAAGIVAGLGFAALAAPAMAQTKPTIAIIVKDTTSVYWQTVLAGARKAGQDLGVNVTELGAQSESDVSGQIGILEKAVASNPAAIVIAPADVAPLGKPIDEAAKKVKIIGIDSAADTKAWTSFLATDDVQAGRMAADALANAMTRTYADTEGDVAIITAAPIAASPDQSATGFKEQVAKKYRALNVLPDKIADAQAATGLTVMKDLVNADRDLRGVFVSNVIIAEGASQVVYNKESGDRINYVVFGSNDNLVKSLQGGTIDALIVKDPFRMGYDAVKTALAASKGESVPATIDTGANVITKANMNSARSQELLNPKID